MGAPPEILQFEIKSNLAAFAASTASASNRPASLPWPSIAKTGSARE
jgi:hypothetical protein